MLRRLVWRKSEDRAKQYFYQWIFRLLPTFFLQWDQSLRNWTRMVIRSAGSWAPFPPVNHDGPIDTNPMRMEIFTPSYSISSTDCHQPEFDCLATGQRDCPSSNFLSRPTCGWSGYRFLHCSYYYPLWSPLNDAVFFVRLRSIDILFFDIDRYFWPQRWPFY